jgi:hypothetical protein
MLKKIVNEHQNNWDEKLPIVRFAHMIADSESTGTNPYFIMYGREYKLAIDIVLPKPDLSNKDMADELENLVETVNELDKYVKQNIEHSQAVMAKQYNKHSQPTKIQIGSLVWLYMYNSVNKLGGKLKTSWHGHYRVIGRDGVNFKLRRVCDNVELPLAVHPDRLQLVVDRRVKPPLPLFEPQRMSDADEAELQRTLIKPPPDFTNESVEPSLADSIIAKQPTDSADASASFDTNDFPPDGSKAIQNSDSEKLSRPVINAKSEDKGLFERRVYDISKCVTSKEGTKYYIIYDDQENKKIGEYIDEKNLNDTEREYIKNNIDKIRTIRSKPKKFD